MTPTFDFSAFLNSPAAGTDSLAFSTLAPSAITAESVDTIQTPFGDQSIQDGTGSLPGWASKIAATDVTHPIVNGNENLTDTPMSASLSQPTVSTGDILEGVPTKGLLATPYQSSIAAHHLAQMTSWLPQLGGAAAGAPAGSGAPGQRSQGGSHSSPSVPLSQAARLPVARKATELTIQERRRLSRRGYAAGQGITQPTSMRNVSQADGDSPMTDNTVVNGGEASMPPSAVAMGFSDLSMQNPQQIPPQVPAFTSIQSDFVKRAYSSTGFDLIGALIKVATRPNPKIEIGPVDLSCSFTVSDARHPDQPIVHCSDTFCNLTGYDRSEVLGRNCRFLQSPDGRVESGVERAHTDNGAVRHLKKHVMRMQECQTSLINYRRDGSPFINLVTIVPITWGDSTEPVFLVGFQVDLVEHPGAVTERKPNGLYVVNYCSPCAAPSMHMLNPPDDPETAIKVAAEAEASKKAMLAQELAEIISSGTEESSKWARILLENSHDIIHVLSLKGTFLYVSPSVEKLLGYKPEELVGRSISDFCHPSDVVPVFRELKDSTSNASIAAAARHWARYDGTVNPPTKGGAGQTGPQVNLIMRMKHKQHGHEWVENVGKLHLEQGKGRKVVISTGRLRPIYNLPWEQARRSLNSRSPGFWFKTSTDGLILSTSGNVSNVVEGGSPTVEHTVPFTGRHLREVVDKTALGSLSSALTSLQVSAIPHMMTNGLGGPSQKVISTVVPSSAGGSGLSSVFIYTQRANATDYDNLQQNAVYCQDAALAATDASQAAQLKVGEPAPNSVFGELSTARSSSWVFELHQLKNANKRLREEVRAHQRRISAGNRMVVGIPPQSPSKTKPAVHKMPGASRLLSTQSVATNSSGSGSGEISPSPTPFSSFNSGSGSGSSTDVTVPSSASEGPTAGVKRARASA